MALPLPRVIADIGPGGGVVSAMQGINALANALHQTKINQVKAQYAPITNMAEASSKLAYANLMGPQFLAKLMGHDSALANLSEDQKRSALDLLYKAGTGQGTGANALNNLPSTGMQTPSPSNNSLSGWMADRLKKSFTKNDEQPVNALVAPASGEIAVPSQNDTKLPPPRTAEDNWDNTTDTTSDVASANTPTANANTAETLKAYEVWRDSPEGQKELAKGSKAVIPDKKGVLDWYYGNDLKNEQQQATPEIQSPIPGTDIPTQAPPSTYAEKTGAYKGLVEEGTEAGKIRAKDIEKLNDTVFSAETNQATLDDLTKILSSKEFEQIRQLPLLGHHELAYYSKEGTPEQQQMVGRYFTDTGNIIKDSSRDFAGQFRQGEQQLLSSMKPNDSDTVDTARGKLESLSYFNKMLAERSKLTSNIMSQQHVNKLQAQQQADKQLNGEEIRKRIHDSLNPKIRIKNSKTGETKYITREEARALGVPNV